MKRAYFLAFLFVILVLAACGKTSKMEKSYMFSGESDHWKAEYVYDNTKKWNNKKILYDEGNYQFTLEYKGSLNELSTVRSFQYSYQTNSSRQSEETTDPLEKTLFTFKGSSEGLTVQEDEVIEVNVQWDDFGESFELHNESE